MWGRLGEWVGLGKLGVVQVDGAPVGVDKQGVT